MTPVQRYHAFLANDRCPQCYGAHALAPDAKVCAECREARQRERDQKHPYMAVHGATIRTAQAHTAPSEPPHPGPAIAHCGVWHALTALPWACPQCGSVLGTA